MKISLNETPYEHSTLLEKSPTFKDLSFKDKLNYIWDYYKWWFIGGIAIIIFLSATIPTIIENQKENVLYTVFLNSNIVNTDSTSIMEDYIDAAGIDMDNKRYTLDCSIYIDRKHASTADMQSSQKLTALFSSKTIDVIISDKDNFDFCSSQGAYKDLRELLPKEFCEKYKDYFVEAPNPETGEMTAYGLSLDNSQVLLKEKAFGFEPILSVCLTTEQQDNAISFIKYLLGEL